MQNKFARTDLAAEAVGRLDRAPEGVFADTLSLHGCEVSRVKHAHNGLCIVYIKRRYTIITFFRHSDYFL